MQGGNRSITAEDEKIGGAFRWLMNRLMHVSRLMDSDNPAEQQLGRRLKAEVLKEEGFTAARVNELPGTDGLASDPYVAFASALLRRGYAVVREWRRGRGRSRRRSGEDGRPSRPAIAAPEAGPGRPCKNPQ